MPSLPIDTDWANAIGSFGYDSSRGPRNMMLGAQYTGQLLENEQKRRVQQAVGPAVDAQMRSYDARFPYAAPMNDYNQFGPPSPVEQQSFEGDRTVARQALTMAGNLAKSPEDVVKAFYGVPAMSEVQRGIPADKARRDVLETNLGPVGAHIPGYDEAKRPVKQIVVHDAAGRVIDGGLTQDGVNFVDGRKIPQPPGSQIKLQQPLAADAGNPFKGDAEGYSYLTGLAQKLQAGQHLDDGDVQRAGILLDKMHPVTNETQLVNGRMSVMPVRKTAVAAGFGKLSALVDDWRSGKWRDPQAVPFAGAGAGMGVPPQLGGLTGVPAAATAPAAPGAAPGAPPIVAPQAAQPGTLPLGAQAGAVTPIAPGDAGPMTEQFQAQKPVKAYQSALPAWNSLTSNIKVNGAPHDVAIIYALAKILDPESVVREGELVLFSKTSPIFERLNGQLGRALKGQAVLDRKTRALMADMGERAMQGHHDAYKPFEQLYSERAIERGLRPEQVLPKFEAPRTVDQRAISSISVGELVPVPGVLPRRDASGAAGGAPAPAGAPAGGAPAAPTRTIRINPQTGAIEEVQ